MTPDARPAEVGSPIGWVHIALLLDGPERTVVTGPFRTFPRTLGPGEPRLMPRPPWFTNRTGDRTSERFTRYVADPRWWRIRAILASALRC